MADEGGFEIARAYVTVDPEAGDFDAKLKEEIGDPRVTVGVDADATEANATVDDLRAKLERLEETAAEITIGAEDGQANEVIDRLMAKLDALEAEHAELLLNIDDEGAQEKIAALSSEMDALQAQMTEVSTAAGVSGVAVAGLGERSAELSTIAAAAAERLNNFGSAAEDVGSVAMASEGDVAALVERFNLANTELTDLERAVTADVPALDSLGGGFKSLGSDIDGFMAQGAGSVEELGRLGEEMTLLETELDELEGQFGTASGAFASFGEAADAQVVSLHNSVGMYDDVAAGLADTEDALGGAEVATKDVAAATEHGTTAGYGYAGMLGMLSSIPTPVVIGAVAVALGVAAYELNKQPPLIDYYVSALQRAAGAAGDNVQNVNAFSRSMQQGGIDNQELTRSLTGVSAAQARFGVETTGTAQAQNEANAQGAIAADRASRLTAQFNNLRSTLSTTVPATERVAGDLNIIGNNADSAARRAAAFGNIIATLSGNMNTLWGRTLTVQQGLLNVEQAAKTTGATMTGTNQASLSLQEAFQGQIATLDSYAQHQQSAGHMTQSTSDYLTLQTAKLALLTGGSHQAIEQVEGMIQQEITWGAKTQDVKTAVDNLATSVSGQFTASLKGAASESDAVKAAADRLTLSILNTGKSSASTAGDRAKLIADLEAVGVSASQAAEDADRLEGSITALHSKTITIDTIFNVSGQDPGQGVTLPGKGSPFQAPGHAASGTIVPGYAPGRDTRPYLLSPGESVLVPELTRAIGPAAIMAANRAYSGGRRSTPGHMAGGGVASLMTDVFNFDVHAALNESTVTGMPLYGDMSQQLAQELKPGSSRSRMAGDGQTLAKAFQDAYKDTADQIKTETKDALSTIREYYSGPAATQLEATISKQGAALENLANKTASVATEIANMKSYAAQETQSLQSYSDVGNIQGSTNPTTGQTSAPTGQQISAGLKQDLATLRKFFSLIGELKAKKVDATMINQVIALGPDEGVTYAEAIIAGGANLIKQINKEESQIASIEVKIGQRAADIEFGQPLALGFLHSLDKEKAELDKRMKSLGDTVAKELQNALEKLKITIPVTTTGKKASTGWRVPGYGGGDRHPALLEGGETVVSKEHSQIPLMQHAFAAAGVPGYSGGGLVLETGQPYIGPRAIAPPTSASGRGAINVNYFGPQRPTPEMEAAMLRKLATAVGAAG